MFWKQIGIHRDRYYYIFYDQNYSDFNASVNPIVAIKYRYKI